MDQLLQALMMLPGVGASMGPAEAAQEEVAEAEEIAEAEEEIAEQKRRAEEIAEAEDAVNKLLLKRKLNGFYEARRQRRLNEEAVERLPSEKEP